MSSQTTGSRPGSILMAFADADQRAVYGSMLRKSGHDVHECATVAAALSAAGSASPGGALDLALVGDSFPDGSGEALRDGVRGQPGLERMPVIFLSERFAGEGAGSSKARETSPLKLPQDNEVSAIDGYLPHPVSELVLRSVVSAFLRASGTGAADAVTLQVMLDRERIARQRAETAVATKDEFLATLSHELRTPLNAIVGWAQLLKRGTLPGDFSEGIDVIYRNALVQSRLISDLMDISRITSGRIRLDMQSVDVGGAVDSAIEAVRASADTKGIAIARDVEDSVGIVSGDPARIQQIVWNLLSNAVKFTPRGGHVEISVRDRAGMIEITVRDNGIGIRPELIESLFERFRGNDTTTTRSYPGLGLGLAIVRSLVEMHGGAVEATSPGPGEGAEFRVRFPQAGAATGRETPRLLAASEDELANAVADLQGVRVLVVEDDADARGLMIRILKECGATVADAATADEGLRAVEVFRPQILVCDIGLPGQDGYTLIRNVRARGYRHTDLPAVAITAFVQPEDRMKALRAGYQVHVGKPVRPTELTAVVASLVGRTGPASPTETAAAQ